MFGKKHYQREIPRKLRKGEHSFLCATRRPVLIHISIKMYEDTLTVIELRCVQESFEKLIKRV